MKKKKWMPLEILEKLDQAKTDKKKLDIIKQAWDRDAEEFFFGVALAFDDNVDFGLKKVPEIQDVDDGAAGEFTFNDFCILSQKLTKKELKGKAVAEAIEDAALKSNISEWNLWYRRILLKTLHKYIPMEILKEFLMTLDHSDQSKSSLVV
jgi:hypothetical protein